MFPKTTRILVVEDMNSVRAWERQELSNLGFGNILEADNGKTALNIIRDQHKRGEPIQLILCDWHMPILDGLGLLLEVKKSSDSQNIPFVMVSAESETPQVLQAVEAGVTHFITKPFSAANLKTKLEIIWGDLYED